MSAKQTQHVVNAFIIKIVIMKYRSILLFLTLSVSHMALAGHSTIAPNIKSLEVVKGDDWMALPVLEMGTSDVLYIGFDELSHNYHRFVYRVEPCNPDWTAVDGLFESDWLEGFNNQPIDDYENSLNTNVLYTHYQFQLPNEQTRLKLSGNYRLYIDDEDNGNETVAIVEFRIVEPLMNVGIGVTTNTDVDFNRSHQQVAMTVNYNSVKVTNLDDQIQTIVMQNGREDNMKANVRPNFITTQSLRWEHNRSLIFEAGSEYHKFEVLDPTHTTMGLASVSWDEAQRRFHAVPYPAEQRRSYIYDEDANGAFVLRNSDNYEAERTSEYVFVHYKLMAPQPYDNARVVVNGRWTTEPTDNYTMEYNHQDHSYNLTLLQKLGYYNYQLLLVDRDGTTHRVPEEGSFFQTENSYQAFVYYRGTGERTWRLVGFQEVTYRP